MRVLRKNKYVRFGDLNPGDVFSEQDAEGYVFVKTEVASRLDSDASYHAINCVELGTGDLNFFNDDAYVERVRGAFTED